MKCLICDKNVADQTGAHIFPAWMTASSFDSNSRTRDHEIIYSMNLLDLELPFIGKSVLTDKINQQIGRDLTDKEITSQRNPLIADNIWCRGCERKLMKIEEYFLNNVHRKTTDFSECNETHIIDLFQTNKYLIRLFLYSIVFRASLTNYSGFTLNKRCSRKIKFFLNTYLQEDLSSTIKKNESLDQKDQLLKYPIRIIKAEEKSEDTSGIIFTHNKYFKPYVFIINNYIIQFYGRGNQAHFHPNSFFGVSSIVRNAADFKNYKEDVFKILLINLETWDKVKNRFTEAYVDKQMSDLIEVFRIWYKSQLGLNPDKFHISLFLKELTINDLPIGIRYSKQKIVDAINRTMKTINLQKTM